MNIFDTLQYNECVAAQARLEQIVELIDGMEIIIDDDTLTEDDWVDYIQPAGKLIDALSKVMGERAKTYTEGTRT